MSWVLTAEYEFVEWWEGDNGSHSGTILIMEPESWPSVTICRDASFLTLYDSLSTGDPDVGHIAQWSWLFPEPLSLCSGWA